MKGVNGLSCFPKLKKVCGDDFSQIDLAHTTSDAVIMLL